MPVANWGVHALRETHLGDHFLHQGALLGRRERQGEPQAGREVDGLVDGRSEHPLVMENDGV